MRKLILLPLLVLCGCWRLGEETNDFEGTGCLEDPGMVVVEARLTGLTLQSTAMSYPAESGTLDAPTAVTALQDTLGANGCVADDSPLLLVDPADATLIEAGTMHIYFLTAGEGFAGGVFDTRSHHLAFSWYGEDTTYARRCTPNTLSSDRHPYTRAAIPDATYTYLGNGTEGGTAGMINDLNDWGATWAESAGIYWTNRDYPEIELMVRQTGGANALALCGDYEMTVISMTSGGSMTDGDVDDLGLVFVLNGTIDGSVVD